MKYPTTVGRILSETSMWKSFFSPINVKLCHEWNEDQRRRRTRKMEEWFLAPAVGFHGMYFSYLQRRILVFEFLSDSSSSEGLLWLWNVIFLENGNINRSFDLGPSENHKGVNQLTQQLLARAVNGEDADPQTVWRRNQHLTSKLLVDKATYTYAYKVLNMITLITWKLYVLKKLQIWVYLCC